MQKALELLRFRLLRLMAGSGIKAKVLGGFLSSKGLLREVNLCMSRKFQGTNYAHYKKCEACERKDFCNEENKPMTAYNILRDSEGFYYGSANWKK